MLIRDAEDRDLPTIVNLVNAFLSTTTTEWTETPYTLEDRRAWLERHRQAVMLRHAWRLISALLLPAGLMTVLFARLGVE